MKRQSILRNLPAICFSSACILALTTFLLFPHSINAYPVFNGGIQFRIDPADSTMEKKVDYIERIYFSGKNMDDMNTMLLMTIQELDGKASTTSVAKQYAFLTGIKEKANEAKNSCDVAELLAVGIYDIDAGEAVQQSIPKPSEKARANASAALANISNISNSARNMAWSSWYLSGGRVSNYGAASKIANTSNTIGVAANTAIVGKQMADQARSVISAFKKDKACKSVPQKNIEIGEHVVPGTTNNGDQKITAGTKIIINNISYGQLSTLTAAIEKISGVSSVNDAYNSNTGTLMINHNLKIKELINKIIEANPTFNFEIESRTENEAVLKVGAAAKATSQISKNNFKDEKIKPDKKFEEIENHQAISNKKVESDNREQIIQVPPEANGTQIVEAPKNYYEDKIFTKVEQEASFPGGDNAFKVYLKENLNTNIPKKNGAPVGTYMVIVKFIVSQEGNISEVQAETKMGYGMEKEAMRVITESAKWEPGRQGRGGIVEKVNSYKRQPITFIVSN